MGAGEQVLLLQTVEVAADGRLGDVQLLGQLGDAHRAALVELLQDQPEADVLSHSCTVVARSCSFRAVPGWRMP